MPDPLQPKPKARRKHHPDIIGIPVEINETVPHGLVILVAAGDKVVKIIARHPVEIDAFTEEAPTLRVLVMDAGVTGAPSIPGLIGALV